MSDIQISLCCIETWKTAASQREQELNPVLLYVCHVFGLHGF